MKYLELLIRGLNHPEKVYPFVSKRFFDMCIEKTESARRLYYNLYETNVYQRDWDVLIVLDACRYDALASISGEYEFLPDDIGDMISVGIGSPQWMNNTFRDKYISDITKTTYITANPHTERVLGKTMEGVHAEKGGRYNRLEDFEKVIQVYKSNWDSNLGTVPAESVTDKLVKYCRKNETDRVIAHFMQPHFPVVPSECGTGMDLEREARWNSDSIWNMIGDEISVDTGYSLHIENLRYVLDELKTVITNLDAETIAITADHGNAFGEYGRFSHRNHIDVVRRVPYIELSATDSGEYIPDDVGSRQPDDNSQIDNKLRALGYRTD